MSAPGATVRTTRVRRVRRSLAVDVVGALSLVGWVVKYLSAAFLFPAAVAVLYAEAVWPFVMSGAVTSAGGWGLERVTRGRERIGAREGFLVVALLWLLIAAFGALPYLLVEPQLSRPVDAFFESMSGFSTTGASVLTDIEGIPRSVAMWRQQTVWLGGIGIIVLFIAVLPRLRVGGRQAMFRTEMPGPEIGLQQTIRDSARRFVLLYLGLTALGASALAALGWTGVDPRMTLFKAIAHAFATIATGGFSTEARSIEAFAPATQWVIVVFMIVAGTNFTLLYAGIVRRRPAAFARDEEFRAYLCVLAAAALVVFVSLIGRGSLTGEPAVRHAVFNTASMMTTTGFASADFTTWPPVTALVLFGLTLLGASAGSTSGSIKLIRHLVVFKLLRRELAQKLHPEIVSPLRVNEAVLDERTLRAIIVFAFLYLGVFAAGAVILLIDADVRSVNLSVVEGLAAAATTLGGVGPGLGFAGPMGSFEPFSDLSTLVLAALMYLGRLEILPILVLLQRSYWRT